MTPQELTLRRAVVTLAACEVADRRWILAQLPEGEREIVVSLLDALEGQSLGDDAIAAHDTVVPWASPAQEGSVASTVDAPDLQGIRERLWVLPAALQVQALEGAPAQVRNALGSPDREGHAAAAGGLTRRAREALYAAVLACTTAPLRLDPAQPQPAPRPWWRRWLR